jgi:adenine-specific DNA-methyltransferase
LDITCGSGTTAFVAETWGRRWITCDTSRVAITLAKQRLLTAQFDYFELAYPDYGISSGFRYKTVPHITLKSIANNEPAPEEILYDQPVIDKKKIRVTGPFTVEAVPAPTAIVHSEDSYLGNENENQLTHQTPENSIARSGETIRQSEWQDELLRTGVRGKGGAKIEFNRIEPLSGTKFIQAEAETKESQRVLICFGPEHAPLEQRTVELAINEAQNLKPSAHLILFCAFQFDEEAAKDIDETNENLIGIKLLKVQMNADLLTDDLRKKRSSNESFWLIGQPDVKVLNYELLVLTEETNNTNKKTENSKQLAVLNDFKTISGLDNLTKINQLDQKDILLYTILAQKKNIWSDIEKKKNTNGNHKQQPNETDIKIKGLPAFPDDYQKFIEQVENAIINLTKNDPPRENDKTKFIKQLKQNNQITKLLDDFVKVVFQDSQKLKLKTEQYTIVEIIGFDYYNPKTGEVESGGKSDIAMWMLDTDYDGRSLYPSQVFFPMSGTKDGWSILAKDLKAELDEEKIETFKGTISLPFIAGKNIAIKIIDARGIESLKIIK